MLAIITAWWVTFTIVTLLFSCCFGPPGVVGGMSINASAVYLENWTCKYLNFYSIPGSLAAAFQSYMYGAFTPAGGIFATLTSMGMLGTLMLPVVIFAAFFATCVAVLVWEMQH